MAKSVCEIARIVVGTIGWQKMTHTNCLTDFDPMVTVMCLLANEIGDENLKKPKGKNVWIEAMKEIQKGDSIENNPRIPCRACDQAFTPIIDDVIFDLFVRWYESRRTSDLLAIHKCKACGGTANASATQKYKGDMHTPEPGNAKSDDHWAEMLLEHCDA